MKQQQQQPPQKKPTPKNPNKKTKTKQQQTNNQTKQNKNKVTKHASVIYNVRLMSCVICRCDIRCDRSSLRTFVTVSLRDVAYGAMGCRIDPS